MKITETDLIIMILTIIVIALSIMVYKMKLDINRLIKCNKSALDVGENHQKQLDEMFKAQKETAKILNIHQKTLEKHSGVMTMLVELCEEMGEEE